VSFAEGVFAAKKKRMGGGGESVHLRWLESSFHLQYESCINNSRGLA
jgi:hypothetical protein